MAVAAPSAGHEIGRLEMEAGPDQLRPHVVGDHARGGADQRFEIPPADEHAGHACHGVCHARGAKRFLGQGKVKMSNYPLKRSRPRKSRVT